MREPAPCLLWRWWGRHEWLRNKVGASFNGDLLSKAAAGDSSGALFRALFRYTLNVVDGYGSSWKRLTDGDLERLRARLQSADSATGP